MNTCVYACVCAEIVAAEPLRSLEAEQVDFPGVGLLTEAYTPELRYCILLGGCVTVGWGECGMEVEVGGVTTHVRTYLLNREKMLRLEKENQIMRKRLESPSGESGQEVSTPHNLQGSSLLDPTSHCDLHHKWGSWVQVGQTKRTQVLISAVATPDQ